MPAHPVAMTAGRPRYGPDVTGGSARERLWPVLVTERGGQVSHYVTDDQVSAPARDADPEALCGVVFIPAALTTPPGPICDECLDRLRAPARAARPARWRRHRADPTAAITGPAAR